MNIIFSIFSFILGSIIASFLGVVAYRVPNKISIIKPDSMCFNCNNKIKWYDNIPIISYLILKGKCRYCHTKIGISSLLLEIFGGLLYLLTYLRYGFSIDTLFIFSIISILIIIFIIDYNTCDIYDFSLIIFGILSISYITYLSIYNLNIPIDNFIGLLVGFLFFFLIRVISSLIYKKEALGLGDVYLMAIAGFLLGWQNLLLAILLGSVIGSVIVLFLISIKVINKDKQIPFGPFLVSGIIIALLYGNIIIDWYLGLVI